MPTHALLVDGILVVGTHRCSTARSPEAAARLRSDQ